MLVVCEIWLVLSRVISHDRVTARCALAMFHTHAPGPDWSIIMQGFIFILKVTVSLLWIILVKVFTYFWKCLRMRTKIWFLKRVWFVRADKTRAWPLFLRGMTGTMPSSFHLNNGRARVISARTSHARFKNNTLIL